MDSEAEKHNTPAATANPSAALPASQAQLPTSLHPDSNFQHPFVDRRHLLTTSVSFSNHSQALLFTSTVIAEVKHLPVFGPDCLQ